MRRLQDRLAATAAGCDWRSAGEPTVRADMSARDRDPGDLGEPERLLRRVSAAISAQMPSR